MRLLIADDHPLFRDGLRSLLEARGIDVVGEASNGREAVEQVRRLRPDVVLMDLSMPEMNGLAATRVLSAEHPAVKVVILTASEDDADLFEAIKSGAQGYIFKNLDSDDFFRLLEGVARGEPALTPGLARKLLGEFARPPAPAQSAVAGPSSLTEREREVLDLLVQGGDDQSRAGRASGGEREHGEVPPAEHPGQVACPESRSGGRVRDAPRYDGRRRLTPRDPIYLRQQVVRTERLLHGGVG
jgi:DNA-binding NarL/FixJ family response regulator